MFDLKVPSFWARLDDESRLRFMIIAVGVLLIVVVFIVLPKLWSSLFAPAPPGTAPSMQAEQAPPAAEAGSPGPSWRELEPNFTKLEQGVESARELLRETLPGAPPPPLPAPLVEKPVAPIAPAPAVWQASAATAPAVAPAWPAVGRKLQQLQQSTPRSTPPPDALPPKGLRPEKTAQAAPPASAPADWRGIGGSLRQLETQRQAWTARLLPREPPPLTDSAPASGSVKQIAELSPPATEIPLSPSGSAEPPTWRTAWQKVRVLEQNLAAALASARGGQ